MKRLMIVTLVCIFTYGLAQSWQLAMDKGTGSPDDSRPAEILKEAVGLVESKAKEPATQDELFDGFLNEMLQSLDPHSNYFSPEAFRELLEDQEGRFFGIGVLIAKPTPSSPLLVINPIQGTPAYNAGMRSGDMITEVEGKPTDKMTTKEAVKMLKGPKGTKVRITVSRSGENAFGLELERNEIPKQSVSYAILLGGNIGYVRVMHFGETTVDELEEALSGLAKKGASAFILDMRDNPGGSLRAAVDMCSLFLRRGKPVVSVRPRKGYERNFISFGCSKYCSVPVAVLINMGSASASEIVAGALQDNGRAVIIGERSWGKGLVQTVTPMKRGAVAITTAHYFTPSGRNIQRSYDSRDSYLFPDDEGEIDAERSGGIDPDIRVVPPKIPPLALKLERERFFLDFVSKRAQKGDLTIEDVRSGAFAEEARAAASKDGGMSDTEWKESRDYITRALEREFRTLKEDPTAGFEAMVPLDVQIKKAVETLHEQLAKEQAA
ncbi:MAG TPA: S41 family peptidase [Acidobacteriota bacterium]|nr:S41 family peptidase [Acidobacteriota bacterium]HNT16295.1 S41 family peptidase [Acidobacteriota bacterium]